MCRRSASQTPCIEHHHQRAHRHPEGGEPGRYEIEGRERHGGEVVDQRPAEVLPDHILHAPGGGDRLGDCAQRIIEQQHTARSGAFWLIVFVVLLIVALTLTTADSPLTAVAAAQAVPGPMFSLAAFLGARLVLTTADFATALIGFALLTTLRASILTVLAWCVLVSWARVWLTAAGS